VALASQKKCDNNEVSSFERSLLECGSWDKRTSDLLRAAARMINERMQEQPCTSGNLSVRCVRPNYQKDRFHDQWFSALRQEFPHHFPGYKISGEDILFQIVLETT
jgi:hypothetical protein